MPMPSDVIDLPVQSSNMPDDVIDLPKPVLPKDTVPIEAKQPKAIQNQDKLSQQSQNNSLRELLSTDASLSMTPDAPIVSNAIKEIGEAGERYPAGVMKTLENIQTGKGSKNPLANIFEPNPDKRSATQISQDIGDRAFPPAEIKDPKDAGQYWGAFAKDFIKDLPFSTAGAVSEIGNPVNLAIGGAISKLPDVNIPAPQWVDNTISGFIKNAGTPFTALNEAAKTHATNAIVDEIFAKIAPRMDELKQNFKDVYNRQATDDDIKMAIRQRLDAEGIQNSNLGQLATRLFGLKAQAPMAPKIEAPAQLPPVEAPQMPIEASKPVLPDIGTENAPILQPSPPQTPIPPTKTPPVILFGPNGEITVPGSNIQSDGVRRTNVPINSVQISQSPNQEVKPGQVEMFKGKEPKNNVYDPASSALPQTGKPFEFHSIRNNGETPRYDDNRYGQDFEPAGKYLSVTSENVKNGVSDSSYEKSVSKLDNPLVVEFKSNDSEGWKKDLMNQYDGKTGQDLTNAIMKDGYDGVVAINSKNNIVNEAVSFKDMNLQEKPLTQEVNQNPQMPGVDNQRLFKDLGLSSESGQVILPIQGLAKVATEFINTFSPKTFVPRSSLDEIMKMKGQQDKSEFVLEKTFEAAENHIDKLPQDQQISIVDNIKLGKPQATVELKNVTDMMRKIEDAYHKEAQQYKPTLTYKQNHFRVLWKVIPGSLQAQAKGGFAGNFRKPLQGTKGFMKQSTLNDMSEGISKGGIPVSYNPLTMWRMGIMDMQKFITANRMWEQMKKLGMVKYVKFGQSAPDGFVKVNDSIAHVYFPVEAGMVDAGQWHVESNTGRILNNYLGRDLIRESATGAGLLAFKNLTTAVELSLSPFHASYVSLAAMSSSTGLGLQKIWNTGILDANPKSFMYGLKDILSGLTGAAPIQYASIGTNAIKMVSKHNFINSQSGQDFIKAFPDAEALLNDLFIGGGKLAINQEFKLNSIKAFQEGIKNKEPWAVAISSIPAANQLIMSPLFEMYIPRLKIGAFLKEMSQELIQRKDELANGQLTRAQLSREVWKSVENRFGEMNFDNLFWDRTFKSALQLAFRSVTWKLGALENISSAPVGQFQDIASGIKNRKIPLLNRNMSWLMGIAVLITAFAEIFQKTMINKNVSSLQDILDPQYDNQGNRVFLNTHLKDWMHLYHSPGGFIANSLSGEIGKILDVWNNKDFYNVEIYHKDDPGYKKALDILQHIIPTPFSISGQNQLKLQSAPIAVKVMAGAGLVSPAPGYMNKSKALQLAESYRNDNMPKGTRTKENFEEGLMKNRYAIQYEKDRKESLLDEGVKEGVITKRQKNEIIKNVDLSPLEHTSKNLHIDQLKDVIEKSTLEEAKKLNPILIAKIDRKLIMTSTTSDEYKNLVKLKQSIVANIK